MTLKAVADIDISRAEDFKGYQEDLNIDKVELQLLDLIELVRAGKIKLEGKPAERLKRDIDYIVANLGPFFEHLEDAKEALDREQYELLKELHDFYNFVFDELNKAANVDPGIANVLHRTQFMSELVFLIRKFHKEVRKDLRKEISTEKRTLRVRAPLLSYVFPLPLVFWEEKILKRSKESLSNIRAPDSPSRVCRRFFQELRQEDVKAFQANFMAYLKEQEESFDSIRESMVDISHLEAGKIALIKRLIELFKRLKFNYRLDALSRIITEAEGQVRKDYVYERRIGKFEERLDLSIESLESSLLGKDEKIGEETSSCMRKLRSTFEMMNWGIPSMNPMRNPYNYSEELIKELVKLRAYHPEYREHLTELIEKVEIAERKQNTDLLLDITQQAIKAINRDFAKQYGKVD